VSTRGRALRVVPVLAVALGLLALGISLASVPPAVELHQTGPGGPVAYTLILVAVVVPEAAVGVLLAARRPDNPIGWLLLTLLLLTGNPADEYAAVAYREHHGAPPAGWVAVLLLGSFPLIPLLDALVVWLFPDGQLPSGRWRRASGALITVGVLLAVVTTMGPGVSAVLRHNVHIDASGNLYPVSQLWTIAGDVTATGAIASLLVWLAVQVPRYRRSSDERRHQLKWLYSGATVYICVLIASLVGPSAAGQSFGSDGPVINDVIELGSTVLAVCIGVAVLKYHLYEIDRIVSRVISYAIITAVLAGVFSGLVVLATEVLPVRTPVAVAVSTLAVAALFNPLRRRVQRAVDHRFNRARYNTEAVVAAFSARLRQTVDFDAVRGDLVAVVTEAFQPSQVSLWLAPGSSAQRADRPNSAMTSVR
jgi:hypothetical protein